MRLNDKTYNILKWLCLIAIPAFLTCLSIILSSIGVSEDITIIISKIGNAVATLIGTLIGVSTFNYNKDKASEEYEGQDER